VYHLAEKHSARVIDFDGSRKSRWPLLEKEAVESRTRVICTFDEFDKLRFSDVDAQERQDDDVASGGGASASLDINFPVGSALTMLDRILMNPNVLVIMLVNDISKIHPGFLRPGRVGSHIVYVSHLTKADVRKIMTDWYAAFPRACLEIINAEFQDGRVSIAELVGWLRVRNLTDATQAHTVFKAGWFQELLDWKRSGKDLVEAAQATDLSGCKVVVLGCTNELVNGASGRVNGKPNPTNGRHHVLLDGPPEVVALYPTGVKVVGKKLLVTARP
jgi:hypothetical protein